MGPKRDPKSQPATALGNDEANAPKKPKPRPVKKLALAVESDGLTISAFERYSAKRKSLSDAEWRKEVLDSLDKSGDSELQAASKYLKDRSWTDASANPNSDDQAMKSLLDHSRYNASHGPYSGTEVAGLPTHQKMWKYLSDRSLALEADWQYTTSVSYAVKDEKGKAVGVNYVDPEKQPGIVKHAGAVDDPTGSFMKITRPADPDNPLAYARVLDTGGSENEAELNIAAMRNLGQTDPSVRAVKDFDPTGLQNPGPVNVSSIAQRTGSASFTADEALDNENTQYAGWLADHKGAAYEDVSSQSALDKTMEKYKDDQEFKDYKQRVKDALAEQKRKKEVYDIWGRTKFGDPILYGVPGLYCGEQRLQVAFCTSPTAAGDQVGEGVWGLYGGLSRMPIATVDQSTLGGKITVNGVDHVGAAGPSSSTPDGGK